jgi:general secretion pathway protein D
LRVSLAIISLFLPLASVLGQVVSTARENPIVVDTVTATPAQDMITLQYPNSDVGDVLRLYETLTGKRVIADNFVQGKVNIFLSKPVPRDEAIKIIEINLLMNGFALIPGDGDIVKVVFSQSKNPRSAGVPIISEESEIPTGERIISYLFKLRYADPTELQTVLGQYLSPPQPYTSFLALPKSSSILVTESSTVIRGLAKIIDQIDVPPAEVVSEFITLQRADASKVVEMLKDLFDKSNQNAAGGAPPPVVPGVRGARPIPNVPQPQPVDGDIAALTALSEDAVIIGKIKISADVRTNRIHVVTRPVNLPFIRKLIAEFDANVEFAKPVTRPLRYISASDVLPVLVQALSEPGVGEQGGAPGAAPGGSLAPTEQQRRATSTVTSPFTGGQTSTATDSTLNISEELSTQPVDTSPKAVTIGNAKIIADQRANTIIVLGNREVVVKVAKILDEMDVKAPQVTLSTVIGELTLNNNEEFGVDYFLRYQRVDSGSGGAGGVSRNTSIPGVGIVNPQTLTNFTRLARVATGGTNVYLAAGDTLRAIVHLLDSTGRFRTISRPTVFTSNNKKAIIASGTEIPVPVNTISSAVGTSAIVNTGLAQQTNIQFKKVALQLEVVPLINSEKEVSLDILQKLDSLAGTTRVDNNDIPNIATRYIRTNVSAPNCSTIILGGLILDDKRRQTEGIPILDRLPVVGALFRNTKVDKQRQELVILMRPEVTLTKLDLYRLRQKNEERMHFGPEIDQDDCPDCPKTGDGKQLPPPDVPSAKDFPPESTTN